MGMFILWAAAAASIAAPAAASERCTALSAAERRAIDQAEKDRTVFPELISYARAHCVSITEARRRMDIQRRDAVGAETEPGGPPPAPRDSIGSIQARVAAGEPGTFAALWIEHQPTYRVVVAFTRDGAATLARYTSDPLFVAVTRGGPSARELEGARDRVTAALQRFGARPSLSMIDGRTGKVEIHAVGALDEFLAAVARGAVSLPDFVNVTLPSPLPHAAPPLPADWRKTVRAFPQLRFRNGGSEPDVLRTGKVVIEGGCLRLVGERRNPVIVWPQEAALDLAKDGTVRILNRRSGQHIGLDKRIVLGGASGPLEEGERVVGADPACPGPYFSIGNFSSYDHIERDYVLGRAQAIRSQRRVSEAEALRLARGEAAREERYATLAIELLRKAPGSFAAIYPYQGKATIKFARDPQAELRRWVPADLRPFVKAERVPRPLAALQAERKAFEDDLERTGLSGGAHEDVEQGRIVVRSDDLAALGRAVLAGKVRVPSSARVQTDGGMPEGQYGEDKMQAFNRRLESVPDWDEMRTLVEATKVPGFLVTYRKGEPDRAPTRAQSLEITRFLISLGFTAADLRALHAEGQYPARAYVEQNGRATAANRALLAQEAVVAEVIDVTPALLGDGYRSTLRLRIVQGLKGDLKVGETVRVRLVSGPGSDGKVHQSNDEPILVPGLPASVTPGSRWFMLPSEGVRARVAALVGATVPERSFALLYGAWPIEGDVIAGTYSEPGLGSLKAVGRQLAPVDTAFDRATVTLGRRLMRRVPGERP